MLSPHTTRVPTGLKNGWAKGNIATPGICRIDPLHRDPRIRSGHPAQCQRLPAALRHAFRPPEKPLQISRNSRFSLRTPQSWRRYVYATRTLPCNGVRLTLLIVALANAKVEDVEGVDKTPVEARFMQMGGFGWRLAPARVRMVGSDDDLIRVSYRSGKETSPM